MRLALLIVLLLLAAAGLATAGVYLLAGLPWALLTGAAVLVAFAAFLRMGLSVDE